MTLLMPTDKERELLVALAQAKNAVADLAIENAQLRRDNAEYMTIAGVLVNEFDGGSVEVPIEQLAALEGLVIRMEDRDTAAGRVRVCWLEGKDLPGTAARKPTKRFHHRVRVK